MQENRFLLPQKVICGYYNSHGQREVRTTADRPVEIYEIELFLADAEAAYINGTAYPIRKDHILIGRPGETRHSVLPFYTYFVKLAVSGEIAQLLDATPRYFHAYHIAEMKNLFCEAIRLSAMAQQSLSFYAALFSLITLIARDAEISQSGQLASYDTVHAAKRFMTAHLSESITVTDVATAVSVSPSYFHTLFSKAVGVTPHRWLLQQRLETAKGLLWNTTLSMDEIATRCGFGCQQQFGNIFRRMTGLSPGKYRHNFIQTSV